MQPMSEIKRTPPIEGWEDFLGEGRGYLRTAINAHRRRVRAFNAVTLYNLAAMAIEKFAMAALMRLGALPHNHTMADLVAALRRHAPDLVRGLEDDLLALDSHQEICGPCEPRLRPPAMDEIPAMLGTAAALLARVRKTAGEPP